MSWQAALERTVTGMGYDLVDVERSAGGLLRVTIDRLPDQAYPTGPGDYVLVEDCELVTRQLQYLLEVEAVEYARLEVSSPGLDRPLNKPADWRRFVGAEVELTLREPFMNRRKWRGVLAAAAPEVAGAGETAWRLELPAENDKPARLRKGGKPAVKTAARTAKVAKGDASTVAPVQQVLDFSLEEVREARLVPVVDFKGRRGAASASEDESAHPAEAEKEDGGQN